VQLKASLTKELCETVMEVRLGKFRHAFPHCPGVLPYRPGVPPYRPGVPPYRPSVLPYRPGVLPYRPGVLLYCPGVLPYRSGGELGAAGAEVGDLEPHQKQGLEGQLQHGHQARGILHQGSGSHNTKG
jgi:hypothetical protein